MKLYTNFLTAIAMGENLTKDLFQFCKLRKHDNSTRRLSFHCHSSLCPQGLVSVGIYSIHICCKSWAIYLKCCFLVQLCCIQENKWLPILKIWDEILTTLHRKEQFYTSWTKLPLCSKCNIRHYNALSLFFLFNSNPNSMYPYLAAYIWIKYSIKISNLTLTYSVHCSSIFSIWVVSSCVMWNGHS